MLYSTNEKENIMIPVANHKKKKRTSLFLFSLPLLTWFKHSVWSFFICFRCDVLLFSFSSACDGWEMDPAIFVWLVATGTVFVLAFEFCKPREFVLGCLVRNISLLAFWLGVGCIQNERILYRQFVLAIPFSLASKLQLLYHTQAISYKTTHIPLVAQSINAIFHKIQDGGIVGFSLFSRFSWFRNLQRTFVSSLPKNSPRAWNERENKDSIGFCEYSYAYTSALQDDFFPFSAHNLFIGKKQTIFSSHSTVFDAKICCGIAQIAVSIYYW